MMDSPDPFAPVETVGDIRFRVSRVKSYRFPYPTICIQFWRFRSAHYVHVPADSSLAEIEDAVRSALSEIR